MRVSTYNSFPWVYNSIRSLRMSWQSKPQWSKVVTNLRSHAFYTCCPSSLFNLQGLYSCFQNEHLTCTVVIPDHLSKEILYTRPCLKILTYRRPRLRYKSPTIQRQIWFKSTDKVLWESHLDKKIEKFSEFKIHLGRDWSDGMTITNKNVKGQSSRRNRHDQSSGPEK